MVINNQFSSPPPTTTTPKKKRTGTGQIESFEVHYTEIGNEREYDIFSAGRYLYVRMFIDDSIVKPKQQEEEENKPKNTPASSSYGKNGDRIKCKIIFKS